MCVPSASWSQLENAIKHHASGISSSRTRLARTTRHRDVLGCVSLTVSLSEPSTYTSGSAVGRGRVEVRRHFGHVKPASHTTHVATPIHSTVLQVIFLTITHGVSGGNMMLKWCVKLLHARMLLMAFCFLTSKPLFAYHPCLDSGYAASGRCQCC